MSPSEEVRELVKIFSRSEGEHVPANKINAQRYERFALLAQRFFDQHATGVKSVSQTVLPEELPSERRQRLREEKLVNVGNA